MSVSETRYCIDPTLLLHTAVVDGTRHLVARGREDVPPLLVRDARFAWAMTALPAEFTRAEALAAWSADDAAAPIAEWLWETACTEGLLLEQDDPRARRAREWARYGWGEAAVYHESTRDYPFLQMNTREAIEQDDQRMAAFHAEEPPPGVYQRCPALATVPLDKLAQGDSANARLAALTPAERRDYPGLGLLLDLCFGERGGIHFAEQGRFLRKAIPSGGARHPTEVFVVAFPGWCLRPGVYHYNVQHHALDQLRAGDFSPGCEYATFDLFRKFTRPPVGLCVFTTVHERPMWRYRDARSWRATLVDAGHAVMAFRTVSEALGYVGYTYQKVRDEEVCALLGINRFRQAPLFVSTIV